MNCKTPFSQPSFGLQYQPTTPSTRRVNIQFTQENGKIVAKLGEKMFHQIDVLIPRHCNTVDIILLNGTERLTVKMNITAYAALCASLALFSSVSIEDEVCDKTPFATLDMRDKICSVAEQTKIKEPQE